MKLIITLSLLGLTFISHAKSSVSFNSMGNIITPDSELIQIGKKANKKGRTSDANKQFKKAAVFGNDQAKVLLANNYIKTKEYATALAWLKLIDQKRLNKNGKLKQATHKLNQALTSNQRQISQLLLDQLKQSHNHKAAQQNRQNWRDDLLFTGTRIRGQVPSQLTVLPIENGTLGINTITITGHEISSQLNQYVYEYDHQLNDGQVTLAPIEVSKN